jgi:hypothetical protein
MPQQYSVDELAEKIKQRAPQLAKFDNREVVSGVIQRQPKMQRFLSTEALKGIASEGKTTPYYGFDIGHEYEAAKGVAGGVGDFLKTIFDPYIPVTGKHGMIDKLLQPYKQEYAKAQQLRVQGHTLEASGHAAASVLPIIGPMAAELGDRVGRQDIGGALTESLLYALMGKKAKDLDKNSLAEGYAKVTKNPRLQAIIHNSAYEDNFVNAKGIDIRDKVAGAARKAQDEVNKHAQAVAGAVDSRNPGGVINAAAEAQNIAQEVKQLVRTPAAQLPWLQKLLKHAPETHPGGLWTFEDARQFRSDVGDALRNSKGVATTVLARTYHSLTEKLAQTAKDYGMEDSWNHYNKLKASMSQNFGDLLREITDSTSGQKVATALLKDKGLSNELFKNLKEYGLDTKDALRFRAFASRALRNPVYRSVLRYVYGSPAGFAAYMGAKMTGAPLYASWGAGATAGVIVAKLMALARMAKVDPAILDEVFSKREMPGPRGVSTPRESVTGADMASPQGLPPGEPPSGGAGPTTPQMPMPPSTLGPVPSGLPSAPRSEAPKPEPQGPKALPSGPKTSAELEREATELIKKSKPATRYSRLSAEAKLKERRGAVDRVTRQREIARELRQEELRTVGSGAKMEGGESPEARRAGTATTAPIDIPELEDQVKEHYGEKILKQAQALRKAKAMPDEIYTEKLKALILMALDKKGL